jgi:hypothetical protein
LKLRKSTKDQYQFQLTPRERDLLLHVVGLYPRIPIGYQPLSKASRCEESNQRLLDEALTETRLQNQKELRSFLSDPQRFSQSDRDWRLTLSSSDVEWLLQILNDVRIGSWIRLGSPETPLKVLSAETAPDLWAMEMAGSFQMRFLELVGG